MYITLSHLVHTYTLFVSGCLFPVLLLLCIFGVVVDVIFSMATLVADVVILTFVVTNQAGVTSAANVRFHQQ